MDFEILQFMVAVSVIFLYLYLQNTKMMYLAIISGVFFILIGIPLVAGGTLNYVECHGHPINTTEMSDPPHTYIVVSEIEDHCFRDNVEWTWGLQEALGCLFILLGLGIILSIHDVETI